MSDFASTMMLRLLAGGLRQRALALPTAASATWDGAAATCSIADKRALIGAVLAHGGPGLVWRLALEIERLAGTPLYQALGCAAGPFDLLARWQRLERYLHARHRIALLDRGERGVTLAHHAPGHPEPPLAIESVLVFGVVAACMRHAGAEGLMVTCPGGHPATLETVDEQLGGCCGPAATGPWTFGWASIAARHGVGAADPLDAGGWPEIARRVCMATARDLAAGYSVDALAARLGMSGRSLQRELGRHGLTLSRLMSEIRSRVAARWLSASAEPIAQIGFLCGFADQAHFTRAFTRVAGVPPARYRLLARAGERGP